MRLDFREDHAASCPFPFEHSPIQPAGDANDGRRCEGPGTVMNTPRARARPLQWLLGWPRTPIDAAD